MRIYQGIIFILIPFYVVSIESKKRIKCPDPIDYTGTLCTLRNREYPISHISIANKQQCVPVYRAPCNTNTIVTNLSYNPKDYIIHLNLAHIKEIEIPYPYATWVFKASWHRGKDKYLLIKVTWHDEKKAPQHFLIEPQRRLTARVKKKIRVADRKLPFRGFKKITIDAIKK
ncbi:MAG: hypothetical protein WD055_01630 [Candidatus Dependentiae bacterium]